MDARETPPDLWAALNARFRFTVDAAASRANAKCPRYWTEEDNGLAQPWERERIWCNPPFSSIAPWVRKAWSATDAELVVMIIPANRTERDWWQNEIEPYRDGDGSWLTVEFLPGRPCFLAPGAAGPAPGDRPTFGCCLLIWHGPHRDQPDTDGRTP